jgi:hypothetical protein
VAPSFDSWTFDLVPAMIIQAFLSLFAVVFQCTAADRRLKQAHVEAAVA